jgi:hypothetical protein
MTWSGLSKLILGFFLAIALIATGGYFAVQYVISEFTKLPARPTFPNDTPPPKAKVAAVAPPKPTPIAASPQPSVTPSASPSPTPTLTPSGAVARITLSDGLNLRQEPSRNSDRIGGVDYNDRVVILEESPDKEWQRVRVEDSGAEGWIRAGYTEQEN